MATGQQPSGDLLCGVLQAVNEIISENSLKMWSDIGLEDESDVDSEEDEAFYQLVAITHQQTPHKKKKKVKVQDYYKEIVPMYSDEEFQTHFRVSRKTVEDVTKLVSPLMKQALKGRHPIPTAKLVLIGLWTFANRESFRQIADRFNISRSSAHDMFTDFCNCLCRAIGTIVKWPNETSMHSNTENFQRKAEFPGVIGAIDCCHITTKAPPDRRQCYYKILKKNYSINLMGCVDHRMKFIDIFVGCHANTNDAKVYRESDLFNKLSTDARLSADYHIIGDGAFPLSSQLLTPFRDNGCLTERQANYNYRHSTTRMVVEQAFRLLKGKFRRLKYLDVTNIANASKIVSAACVLHNMYIENDDWSNDDFDVTELVDDDEQPPADENDVFPNAGSVKRDEITDNLP